MSLVVLTGTLSNVKAFDGKTAFAFARVGTAKGSYSVSAFDKVVAELLKLDGKNVLIEGYLKSGKKKDGSWKEGYDVVVSGIRALESTAVSNTTTETNTDDNIPF